MKENIKVAVIGGSGIYNISGLNIISEHFIDTPFGKNVGPIFKASMGIRGKESFFYFLARHGSGHTKSPSEINYRANVFALKLLSVDTLISLSAVGSLKDEYSPGMFVLPSQFVDWTKGLRKRTFFEKGMVGHVSCACPIYIKLQDRIELFCRSLDINCHKGGTYVCIEGPQFSTKAESNIFRSFGADIVGMTNLPEAYLAKEAGIAYSTIAMVTDYDCWKEEHCTVEEIMKVMESNKDSVEKLILPLIADINTNPLKVEPENRNAVMTSHENLDEQQKYIIEVLMR